MPEKHKHKYKLRTENVLIYAECECGDSWTNIRTNLIWPMTPAHARTYWFSGWIKTDTHESAREYLRRMEMLE